MVSGTSRRLQVAAALLSIFVSSTVCAADYWITYALRVDDMQVAFEDATVSKAMTPREKNQPIFSFSIDDDRSLYLNEWAFISANRQLIVDALLKYKSFVKAQASTYNHTAQTRTKIELPPVRIGAAFNQDYATITVYE